MIRVYSATDRDFTSTNGDAVIRPIKSRVKNNINGEFSYELTCESKFYNYLKENKLLLVDTPQGVQPFRINNQVTRKGNRITVKARHVFYDASNLVIRDSYAVDLTCKQALEHFNNATDTQSPFKMDSNINTVNSFRCVRKSLLEAINTVLERWGGYLVRDYWNITINNSIGRDNGITIEYRKNLQELTAQYDYNNVCTKALPVGKDGLLLPELYVYSQIQYEIPYTKVISIDQGNIIEDDYPTAEAYTEALIEDLRAQTQAYVNANCVPVVTYTLKGKPEVVSDIGDIIRVRDTRIGVDITTQVIGYEYDTITGTYASLTFGNFGTDLGDLMSTVKSTASEVVNEAMGEVRGSINKIYELLQGSYVVYRGYDILVMDAIPMSVAQHVIRFSNYGISVSNDGVNGTYTEVYNIETQKLTVPSISLHGMDVEEELEKKLEPEEILAGDGIKITRQNGKVTIASAGGSGGLKWWVEEENNLFRRDVVDAPAPYGWDCDSAYKWNNTPSSPKQAFVAGLRQGYGYIVLGTCGDIEQDGQTCFGLAKILNGWGNRHDYCFVSVSSTQQRTLHVYNSGDCPSYEIMYNEVKFYYSIGSTQAEESDPTTDIVYQYPTATVFGSTFATGISSLPYLGEFETNTDAVIALIEQSHLYTNQVTYTGLGIGNYTAWGGRINVVGNSDNVTPSDMDWNINKEGAFNGSDYKINGTSIDSIYQKKLIAGDNINVAPDGRTISATDTTYSPFTGATSQSAGSAGLVPAPLAVDIDKFLKGDGTWGDASTVEANPSGTATTTLNTIEIDGVIYTLPSGGSGGGGGVEIDILYDDGAIANNTIQLTQDVTRYDYIYVVSLLTDNKSYGADLISVDDLINIYTYNNASNKSYTLNTYSTYYMRLQMGADNTKLRCFDGSSVNIIKIYGLKTRGGSSSEKVDLFTNTGTTNPATITLDRAITDFDFIMFQTRAGSNAIASMIYDVSNLATGDTIGAGWYNGIYAWYYYTDANTLTYRTSAGGGYISNITGIKLGSGGSGVKCKYIADTETLYFVDGAQYDEDTETVVII